MMDETQLFWLSQYIKRESHDLYGEIVLQFHAGELILIRQSKTIKPKPTVK